jgi:hypothetical protein
MNVVLCALLACCVATSALAAEKIDAIGLVFPDRLGSFQLKDRHDFPQRALGVNIGYVEPERAVRGSVYIYNAGASVIPSGIDAPSVQKHFEQVIDEVKSLEKSGQVRAVTLTDVGARRTQFSGCGVQFLWREYDMNVDGNILRSATYLTAVNNNFVKLRMTYRGDAPASKTQVDKFVADMSKVLGRCA